MQEPPKVNVPDNTGTLPDVPAGACIKAGHFEEVWFKTEYSTNDNPLIMPKAIARFTSDSLCEQEFYLESGVIASTYKPLAFLSDVGLARQASAYGSACDSNKQYAGAKVKLKPKESVNVWFYPAFPTELGAFKKGFYDVVVGAYTGCMVNGNPNNNYVIKDHIRNIRYSSNLQIYTDNTWQEAII